MSRPGARSASTNTDRSVCSFFLQGKCRFGENCHHYHPPRDGGASGRGQSLPYHLSKDTVKADLTYGEERPVWPLSAYGPGKDAPRQLLEGAIEQSPEELRVQYYIAQASGSGTQQYELGERGALEDANQQVGKVLSDLEGALKYVIDGKDAHPNRDDLALKPSRPFDWRDRPSFNAIALTTTNGGPTFGQTSAPASNGAFGQPAANSTSAFGAPSGPSAFGKPSTLSTGTSAFGKPSSFGASSSAFGQPSALGGSPFGTQNNSNGTTFGQGSSSTAGSTFGQTSAPGGINTFGRPSPFAAAASSATPAFGQSGFGLNPAAPTATSTFGQSAQQQPAFGQPSQPTSQTSAFGKASQPSAFGQPSQTNARPSPFGQPSQPGQQTSAFGQPSQSGQQQSTFGSASPFGGGATATGSTPGFGQSTFGRNSSPFATASAPNASQSPFGQPSAPTQQQPSAFGSTNGQPNGFGNATASSNPFGSQGNGPASTPSRPPGQPLNSFRGQSVFYEDKTPFYRHPQTGKRERIWMPDGPPAPNPDAEAADPATAYEGPLGAMMKQVYDFAHQHGTFKDGLMPEIPPSRDMISWDL